MVVYQGAVSNLLISVRVMRRTAVALSNTGVIFVYISHRQVM